MRVHPKPPGSVIVRTPSSALFAGGLAAFGRKAPFSSGPRRSGGATGWGHHQCAPNLGFENLARHLTVSVLGAGRRAHHPDAGTECVHEPSAGGFIEAQTVGNVEHHLDARVGRIGVLAPRPAGATEAPLKIRLCNGHVHHLVCSLHARCPIGRSNGSRLGPCRGGRAVGSGSVTVMSVETPIDDLAALFVFLADTDFAGYSPLYESLARAVAADTDLLAFISGAASPNTRRGRIPVLFFAAVHDAALANPGSDLAAAYRGESSVDPFEALVRLIDEQRELVTETMRTRSVQTNEVGRSALLRPAIIAAAGDARQMALVEVGPSAGINLFLDRFHISYERDGEVMARVGPQGSPVQLSCALWDGQLPPLEPLPDIVMRTGIDLSPIDAADPRQRRWLSACIWPGQTQRAATLSAALDVVAERPPALVGGDAVSGLVPLVNAVGDDVLPVVVATWALAYLSASGRQELVDQLDGVGAERDLAFVTFEEPRFTPWIPQPVVAETPQFGEGTRTAIGLRSWRNGRVESQLLGFAHPHGRWLAWDPPVVGGS